MTGDEMVGWHHGLNGHEFEQALGEGERQGSLACCSPWGHKESDMTERLPFHFSLWFSSPHMVQTHPHMSTGKTIALTRRTFVGKVMPLLFNMLSRLVIAFFPRSRHLLICVVDQWLCPTLCDPMDCSMPGFPVLHHILEFAPTHVY